MWELTKIPICQWMKIQRTLRKHLPFSHSNCFRLRITFNSFALNWIFWKCSFHFLLFKPTHFKQSNYRTLNILKKLIQWTNKAESLYSGIHMCHRMTTISIKKDTFENENLKDAMAVRCSLTNKFLVPFSISSYLQKWMNGFCAAYVSFLNAWAVFILFVLLLLSLSNLLGKNWPFENINSKRWAFEWK